MHGRQPVIHYNLYFEISAIIILAILGIALIIRKTTANRNNVLFIFLVFAIMITAIIDVLEALSVDQFSKYALDYTYFIIRNLTPPIYVLYICSFIGIWHRINGFKPLMFLVTVPYLVDLAFILSNTFTHAIFSIDENAVYSRGPYMYVLYVVAFYYMFLSLVILIHNRKLIDLKKNILLLIFLPLNLFTVLVQMLVPGYRTEVFGTAILAVIMAVGVHKPEEYLDNVVGLTTAAGFLKDIKNIIDSGCPSTVLIIKDTNHKVLKDTLGFDLYSDLTRKLGEKFKSMNSLTDSKAELYFLEQGTFAAVTSYSRYNMIYNFGRMISDFVRAPFKLAGMEIMLDTRMCLINCPNDIDNADAMIGFVNAIEYRIHENDRLVIMSDISESKEFRMRNDMNTIIARGISGHNFQMYYQPIYSVKEKRFTSAEALIRLIDEEYGFVSPALFIPVAEQTGAIHHIGDYVIDAVCRFVSSDSFKELGIDYIEVNLSVAQCIEANLAEKFESVLKKYGVSPSQINLEITETSVDYDPAVTDRNIDRLSSQGFSFSLDDYGTGYSNIRRVVTLPLDIVKLDKCLVDDMDNESMWIVIHNTVDMLKRMKKKILVEGVETQRALERFCELGCDFIQGFYFSKPLPEREFIRFIKRSKNSL